MSLNTSPSPETFHAQIAGITGQIAGRGVDAALQEWLNATWGSDSDVYKQLKQSCQAGVAAGWLCNHEAAGIRYGRIFKPDSGLHGFSVDVVDMQDIAGPHHVHPQGEIDLVMPIEGDAHFDGHRPAGWCARLEAITARR